MRPNRIKPDFESAIYHCVSRIVDRQFILGSKEKDLLYELIQDYSRFGGLFLFDFVLMANHLHLLVQVPPRPPELPSDQEIIRRLSFIHHRDDGGEEGRLLSRLVALGASHDAQILRQKICSRMWDISHFMKMVLQRFSQRYNRIHNRKGVLWGERFSSTLVESGEALAAVAAYIDLNPVRAGIHHRPEDYRWSGYGRAMRGDRAALEAIAAVVKSRLASLNDFRQLSEKEALEMFRTWLYAAGEEVVSNGEVQRKGFSPQAVASVLKSNGKISLGLFLRCKVRYFTAGVAVGSRNYLERIFNYARGCFGAARKTGPRPIRGLDGGGLFVLRDLKKDVIRPGAWSPTG